MSTRYIAGAMFAVLGGFFLVVGRSFSPSVVGWLTFGVGSGIVLTALAQLDSGRGCAQRILDGATVVVSAVLIAFGVGASGRAVTWLMYALAVGTAGMSFAGGLSLNEVTGWRLSVGLGTPRRLPGGLLREPVVQLPRAA